MDLQDKVLEKLRGTDKYLSGEALSRSFGVTRAAVWKAVDALRKKGYAIESVPSRGYHLTHAPDLLTEGEIRCGLTTRLLGNRVVWMEETDSTNNEAKRQAVQGAAEGTVFIAERQTGGKGRLGRPWSSPAGGGIWMTVLLRPQLSPTEVGRITLLAGLAVCRALRGLGLDALIKWPNDIVISGKKVCGILTEMAAEEEQIHYVVVGMGVNCNIGVFPEELGQKATSLLLEAGHPFPRAPVARSILTELEACYDQMLAETTYDPIPAYRELCVSLNRQVRVPRGGKEITGTAVDVTPQGELVIALPDGGRIAVGFGEVAVQGIYGQ